MNEQPPRSHFADRWNERGDPSVDGATIKRLLEYEYRKVRKGEYSKYLEFVQEVGPNQQTKVMYRFVINGVPWYAMMNKFTGYCITVYDQKFMRVKKMKRRRMKKWRSGKGASGKKARALIRDGRR
jgi:hypothetical protein